MKSNLITAGLAAKILGVNRSRIYQMVTEGKVTPVAIGIDGILVFDRRDIERMRDRRDSESGREAMIQRGEVRYHHETKESYTVLRPAYSRDTETKRAVHIGYWVLRSSTMEAEVMSNTTIDALSARKW